MRWLLAAGVGLVLLGLVLAVAAWLSVVSIDRPVQVSGGAVGCVVVVFVPICFGVGESSVVAWGLAAAAGLLAVFVLLQWLLWRGQKEQ